MPCGFFKSLVSKAVEVTGNAFCLSRRDIDAIIITIGYGFSFQIHLRLLLLKPVYISESSISCIIVWP